MDNQDNQAGPAPSPSPAPTPAPNPPSAQTPDPDKKKSLTPKLLVTLVAVLVIGGLIFVFSSGSDDQATTPADTTTEESQPAGEDQQPDDGALVETGNGSDSSDQAGDQSSDPADETQPDATAPAADNENDGDSNRDPGSDQTETSSPALAPGQYIEYDNEAQLAEFADRDVWLNFHLETCPFCRALDENINANLDQIPAGVVILKVDYDKNQNLRVRYGINRQTVIVRIDSDGNEIGRFDGYGRNSTIDNLRSTFGY